MSFKTLIQWCHHTINFWIGCAKLVGGKVEGTLVEEDPACFNCYAATLDKNRYSKTMDGGSKALPVSHWGFGAPRHITNTWGEPIKWNRKAGKDLAAVTDRTLQERPRVFCGSMCDWADCEVSDEVRSRAFDVIDQCPNLDWMLLSKREQKAVEFLMKRYGKTLPDYLWLGFSAGNQEAYDIRSEAMSRLNARVKFFSFEPLFEDIQLGPERKFDLGIYGGESGPASRPQNVRFIRNGIIQCRALGIAPFVKQLGKRPFDRQILQDANGMDAAVASRDLRLKDSHGGDMEEWPTELRVREMPGQNLTAESAKSAEAAH